MRKVIIDILPPFFLRWLRKFKQQHYGWTGNYTTWDEAKKSSIGYDDEAILQKVRVSLLKVKNSEAVYERDSVLFDEIQYSWPLLAGLMYVSTRSNGQLNVVDFGGSLGSTYYQNKKFLDSLNSVTWSVVEQKHFVEIGKANFEDTRLKFYYNIKECIEEQQSNVLVLSSVIQYIEHWEHLIEDILHYYFEYIIVDLTPFAQSGCKRLTVQKVPPNIYKAEYPCWIFSLNEFKSMFSSKYELVEEFIAMNELKIYLSNNDTAIYKGFIYQRKKYD